MDANEMTPAQLRELADRMESRPSGIDADEHERLIEAIRGGKVEEPECAEARPGYMRRIEIDGIPLDIDMRRVKDLRTLRLVAEIQKGGDGSLSSALELADFIFGDQREKVERAASDSDGFVDAAKYTDIFTKLFKAVGAKN